MTNNNKNTSNQVCCKYLGTQGSTISQSNGLEVKYIEKCDNNKEVSDTMLTQEDTSEKPAEE